MQLSPNLIRKLQGLEPDPRFARSKHEQEFSAKGRKSTPSSKASEADIDEIVSSRVQRELEAQQQRRLVFEGRSAENVRREAEDLLRRLKLPPKPHYTKEYAEKTEAVVSCYRANPGRTLDCWKEVEELKETVRKAQQ
ncbi:hypothetical protein HDU76_005051, partial [Blyttiomyces sp. JEL0837]